MAPSGTVRWNYRAWLGVLFCTLAIYLTVPLARTIQEFVANTFGRAFFGIIVIIAICLALILSLYWLIFRLKIRRLSQYIWLVAIAGVYTYYTISLWKNPEEAVHFPEYGLLAFSLFNALRHRIRDLTIYFIAAGFVLLLGTIDEIIQWMVPARTWAFRDVWLNFSAAGLFLLALWQGIKPKAIGEPVRNFSVKMLLGVVTLGLILLGLCYSNTPVQVYRYTSLLKPLSWLCKEEPMSEFGYKHHDPEIGTFFSRLTLSDLNTIDESQGAELGKILGQEIAREENYSRFLATYNPLTNPFLYELRIHLFRRDRYDRNFYQFKALATKQRGAHIIISENRIAEKYFSRTLEHSPFKWPAEKVLLYQGLADQWEKPFTSHVSINIVTAYNLLSVWVVILVLLGGSWGLGMLWMKKGK